MIAAISWEIMNWPTEITVPVIPLWRTGQRHYKNWKTHCFQWENPTCDIFSPCGWSPELPDQACWPESPWWGTTSSRPGDRGPGWSRSLWSSSCFPAGRSCVWGRPPWRRKGPSLPSFLLKREKRVPRVVTPHHNAPRACIMEQNQSVMALVVCRKATSIATWEVGGELGID